MLEDPSTDELTRLVLEQTLRPGAVARAIDILSDAARRVIVATVYLLQTIARRSPAVPPAITRPHDKEPLIDARQLAGLLGWSEATVYRKAKTGEIPCVRIGKRSTRFRFSDVEKVIKE